MIGPECPYCKKENEFDGTGGDPNGEWSCQFCEMNFEVTVDWDPTWYSEKKPCANGDPHKMKADKLGVEFWQENGGKQPFNCEYCGWTTWKQLEVAHGES